ncbi:MAG: UDP-3-O-(3-hydroxymyristoyl)glucosamine N-acyltransferase [Bacteroidales bacterium]|nr:UDP-3-O-(3-hydroxymyristoyl)glucosamine N-acyltransferase [Bacteroidales bacterium]
MKVEFTAAQIAALLGGKVEGDPEAKVWNVARIEDGAPGMLSFLSNPKYIPFIYDTLSSIVLVNEDFEPTQQVKTTMIKVKNAYESFAQLLAIYQEYTNNKVGISENSFISSDAEYGEGCYIGDFAFVGERVKIGNNVKIYPLSYVGDDVVVGDNTVVYPGVKLYAMTHVGKNCIIHSGAVLGADGFGFVPQPDGTFKKIPQIGNVFIGDDVEIGANTTIDRSTMESTKIHNGVKLDNLIQIAHNVEIGENTAMAAQSGVAGSAHVGKNCIIAGQVGISGHLTVADHTTIGPQSGLTKGVSEPGKSIMGAPAYDYSKYMKDIVRQRNIEKLEERIAELEKKLSELLSK